MNTPSANANVIPLHNSKAAADAHYEAAMKESLARLPHAIQRLREVAQKQLKASIQNLFDHVDDALFELADRAASNLEQNVFFESMREIRIQRRAMEKSFLLAIDQRFAGLLTSSREQEQVDDDLLDSDELSLVSKDELEELVAVDSLVSKSWAQNKNALRVLTARINSLVANPVTEKNNPLTPRALADSFTESTQLLTIDIKAKLVLFKLFERYVMSDLASVLNEVNRELTAQGVAIPKMSSRPTASARRQGPATQTPAMPNGNTEQATGLYATLQSLMQPVQKNTSTYAESSYAAHHSPDDYGVTEVSYNLLQALSQLQQQQRQQAPVTDGLQEAQPQLLTSGYIQSAVQAATGQELVDGRSQDVIKLVDMLFSFILEDRNLPDPVKLLLSRLQIPFIKVALADDDFFKKDGHPARRLLNEMAMASIGWTGGANGEKRDPLLAKIESTVDKILTDFDSNFEIFTLLLTDFIAFMEKERRRMMLFEKRAIDAEDGKAKAEVGRQKVDGELNKLMAGKALPDSFVNFIQGPWSNILFLVYMRQGVDSQPWQSAVKVVKELIWSAQPVKSDEHRQKLSALLSPLQNALKKGLDNIAFNPAKQARFFEQFSAHHQALFNAYDNPQVKPVDVPVVDQIVEEPVKSLAQEPKVTVAQTAVEKEVTQEKFVVVDEPTAEKAVVKETPVADAQYMNLVDNFTVGVWCEKLDQSGGSFRCRLAAIIRATGKYIFVNRAGVKVAEETRDSLALLLQTGNMRTLDDSMLFDRALESVISNLRQQR